MNELLTGLAIPAVYTIIEAIKHTEKVDKKYLPLISQVLGVSIAVALSLGYGYDVLTAVLTMLVLGSVPVAAHEALKGMRK